MPENHPAIDIEELLAHGDFVRAVVLRILRRGSDADDVVQETFTTAIEKPPRDRSALRAWLARVARNASLKHLRDGERRNRREERAARTEATPSAADLASRLELHRSVVDAILRLAPAYRTVVLYRFYEGLSPAEIGELLDVPAATIRTRLRRALAAVRERLQSRHGGNRRSLALALLPLVSTGTLTAPRMPPAVLLGGILMVGKTKLIGFFAVLLVLFAGAILVPELRSDRGGRPIPDPVLPVVPAAAVPVVAAVLDAALPEGAEEVFVTGCVVTPRRFPVEGAEVRFEPAAGGVRMARTGADGRFRIPAGPRLTEGFARFFLYARTDDRRAAWLRGIRWLVPESPMEVDVGVVILGPAAPLSIRVVRDGRPVCGARVFAGLRNLPGVSAQSGEDGIARLPDLPLERGYVLLTAIAGAGGRGSAWASIPEESGKPVHNARLRVGVVHRLPGMTVKGGSRISATAPAPTDENGWTVIRGVGARVDGDPWSRGR